MKLWSATLPSGVDYLGELVDSATLEVVKPVVHIFKANGVTLHIGDELIAEDWSNLEELIFDEVDEHYELPEIQQSILELVQEGSVFATTDRHRGRVTFVAAQHATDDDREFTKGWLEHPHFGTQ